MKPNKKTWSDPLVELANHAQNKDEKKLRGILRAIARFKNTRIPKKIVDELERVNKKVRFIWITAGATIPATDFWHNENVHRVTIEKDNVPISLDYCEDKGTGDEQLVIRPAEDFGGRVLQLIPPHLGSWHPLSKYDGYLWDLIPKLRDPNWVAALRECPGCGKLLMSSTEWAKKGNKFCSLTCKNNYWNRKKRERDKRDPPKDKTFQCPGNFEHVAVRRGECLNGNGKNIRGKFREDCSRCPHNKEGGR